MCLNPWGPWYNANMEAMFARRAWVETLKRSTDIQLYKYTHTHRHSFFRFVKLYLGSADVAGGFVPADVLLSCLESQTINLFTSRISVTGNIWQLIPTLMRKNILNPINYRLTWSLRPSFLASSWPDFLWLQRMQHEAHHSREALQSAVSCPRRCQLQTHPEDATHRAPASLWHSKPVPLIKMDHKINKQIQFHKNNLIKSGAFERVWISCCNRYVHKN